MHVWDLKAIADTYYNVIYIGEFKASKFAVCLGSGLFVHYNFIK
jgi:hypothetical protein